MCSSGERSAAHGRMKQRFPLVQTFRAGGRGLHHQHGVSRCGLRVDLEVCQVHEDSTGARQQGVEGPEGGSAADLILQTKGMATAEGRPGAPSCLP